MQELERELSVADFFVFFISPNSVESQWVASRDSVALFRHLSGEGGAAILPVILRDADVPPLCEAVQWLDVRGNHREGSGQLVDAIRHSSAKGSVRKSCGEPALSRSQADFLGPGLCEEDLSPVFGTGPRPPNRLLTGLEQEPPTMLPR
jgi:hypothetical protein